MARLLVREGGEGNSAKVIFEVSSSPRFTATHTHAHTHAHTQHPGRQTEDGGTALRGI